MVRSNPWRTFFDWLFSILTILFIFGFLFALVLTGCATVPQFIAPSLVDYSKEFQTSAAVELDAIKDSAPHVAQMIVDYGKLRAAIRAVDGSRIAAIDVHSITVDGSGPAPVAPETGAGRVVQILPNGDE